MADHDELRQVAARLAVHCKGCGSEAVIKALAPLVTLYGVSDRSEGEWTAFWRFYIDALERSPIEALKAGVADYVAHPNSEFFPKPGPLKALVDKRSSAMLTAMHRADRAVKQLSQGQAA